VLCLSCSLGINAVHNKPSLTGQIWSTDYILWGIINGSYINWRNIIFFVPIHCLQGVNGTSLGQSGIT
jgi:hypothetical protein